MHSGPTFCCGDYVFSVDGDQDLVRTITDSFTDMACDRTPPIKRWWLSADHDAVTLSIDETEVIAGVTRALMPAHAVSTLTRAVLDHEPDLLHLHAATVVDAGYALVVAGPSGSGKSTLCTALVSSGWDYVSDEIVSVDPESLHVSSFPKPISVKRHAISTIEQLAGIEAPADKTSPWMLTASKVGSLAPLQPYELRTLVLYTYKPDEPTSIVPMHRATMVRELLADGQDAERMGDRSLMVAAQLAAGAQCVRVSTGDALDAAGALRRNHGKGHEKGSVSELMPVGAGGVGPRRASDTSSVIVDGRALIFDSDGSRIVELDEPASTWWSLCDGTPFGLLLEEYAELFEVGTEEAHERGSAAIDQLQELDLLAGFQQA